MEGPEPEWPDAGDHLAEWFWDLNASRSQGINGPNPISLTDIANWAALTGTILRREEVMILRRMDAAYVEAVAEEHQAQKERSKESKNG